MSLGIPGLGGLEFPFVVLDGGLAAQADAGGCWVGIVEEGCYCVPDCDEGWLFEFPDCQDHCNLCVRTFV
jgi:hypothetical protein